MAEKRISALTEQTGLATGDFLAIDNAGETESKKIDQAYFSGQYADMNNILGSKNLMPNNAVTVVIRGVTWTINSDGTIKANGTASGGDSTLYYVSSSNEATESITIPKGKYIYTCLTSAGSDSTFRSEIYNRTNPARIGWDYGEGVTFTLTAATNVLGSINIRSGQTVTNEIFKPMLRPAAVADSTYVPYAKSNKELTDDVATSNSSLNNKPFFPDMTNQIASSGGWLTSFTYTATQDCWVLAIGDTKNTVNGVQLKLNGNVVFSILSTDTASVVQSSAFIPLKKGDIISKTAGGNGVITYFVYGVRS